MLSVRDSIDLVRHLGAGWVLRRALYAARRRLGGLERAMPRCEWAEVDASPVALIQQAIQRENFPSVDASALGRGEFLLFGHHRVDAGFPPEWRRNQLTGQCLPGKVHWSRLGDFSFGDIKGVWELSRFGWAYDLVRDGSEEATATFWCLWTDWMHHNPPNSGPNWMCGQESSIRLMAVTFAAERLGVPPAHRDLFARFVVATGERVRANLNYALAQGNNHGVSECVGLLTAALLLPERTTSAGWQRLALDRLKSQMEDLIYPDGAFSQHSVVYHRVALQQLCWASTRLTVAGETIPDWLVAAGQRATDFLGAITDPTNGEVPLYGANDGANILPLADARFLDLRPTVQLGCALFHGRRWYAAGPWDEPAAWLVPSFSQPLCGVPPALRDFHAPDGGLLQLVAGDSRLVMRCPTVFRHRPSHGDFGHVDVWVGGRAVAIDGGSYSYNSGERFIHLSDAREHNVPSIEGLAPMRQVTRFMQLPWPTAEMQEVAPGWWRYRPRLFDAAGVHWERVVQCGGQNAFWVRDTITGVAGRVVRWHWRLVPAEWVEFGGGIRAAIGDATVELRWAVDPDAAVQVRLLRADATSAAGWQSRHYGAVEPAVSLILTARMGERVEARFEFSSLLR